MDPIAAATRPIQDSPAMEGEWPGEQEIFCRGESMRPLFRPGDRIRFVPCRVEELRRGDVIVFNAPGAATRIVHRVVSVGAAGVRTRGDANDGDDGWQLLQEALVGRVLSVERAGRLIAIHGGFTGHLLTRAIRLLAGLDHRLATLLHPVYRSLARRGMFRRLVPASLSPRIIAVQRQEGREMQLLMGGRVIGRRPTGATEWTIRRPFRIFVDEQGLP
jgi:hypothetical protein